MKQVVIGFLGGGNIGGCTYRLIEDMQQEIAERCGVMLVVKKVLVKDLESFIPNGIPEDKLVFNIRDIIDDPEIGLVAEFMGGEHPAADFMLASLQAGKHVITANKVALAQNWHTLQKAADAHDVGLYFEASVGGAIPIIATLQHSMLANRIDKLMGIINGTTNYILSRMDENGEDYAAVLKDAQKLGLAEPNPSTDVEGYDAAYKLSILASLAFHTHIPCSRIYREGITKVTAEDIASGKEMGYVLKLLAVAKRDGDTVEARVHPTFIRKEHPLARVSGSFNAVYIHGHSCEDMMLQGYGAGTPTASAVVSDIINAATNKEPVKPTFSVTGEADTALHFTDNWRNRCFIRVTAEDRPGMLSEIAGCFAREQVSIAAMQQKKQDANGRVTMIFITHTVSEQSLRAALSSLNAGVCTVENVIRVEE